MTSLLRRLAVPLVAVGLLVIVVVVGLVVLDLAGPSSETTASLTAIQIGDIPVDEGGTATSVPPTASTAPGPDLGTGGADSGAGSGPGQGAGQTPGTARGEDVTVEPGQTIRAGKTTIVTEGVRIQQRLGHQDGPTTTTGTTAVATPASSGTGEGTTTTGEQGPTSTGRGMHGTPSTRHGR